MNYNTITTYDVNNGSGFRISIWIQGCSIKCKGCHNKELWDFDKGEYFSYEVMKDIVDKCKDPNIDGITILGGEPLDHDSSELNQLKILIEYIKSLNKTVWLYTGHYYETLNYEQLSLCNECDVVVDGPYVESLRDTSLPFRGSSNQRIIDIQETLKHNKIITKDDYLS